FNFSIKNFSHGIELLVLFIFLNMITYFGFQSFIPGENKKKSFLLILVTLIPLLYTLFHFLFYQHEYNIVRSNCEYEAMGISLIATTAMHFLIKKNEFAWKNLT